MYLILSDLSLSFELFYALLPLITVRPFATKTSNRDGIITATMNRFRKAHPDLGCDKSVAEAAFDDHYAKNHNVNIVQLAEVVYQALLQAASSSSSSIPSSSVSGSVPASGSSSKEFYIEYLKKDGLLVIMYETGKLFS